MRPGVFSAVLAGLASGLVVLGVGGRVAMRLLALAAGREPQFGAEGTFGIIVIGGALGTVGGLLFALVAPRLPRSRALAGAIHGTLVLAVLAPLLPPAVREEIEALKSHLVLAASTFWLLFALYGIALATLADGAPARPPRNGSDGAA